MSTDIPEDTVEAMEFEFTFYPIPRENEESEGIEMRNIILGLQPLILIEPREGEDGSVVLKVGASEIDLEGMEVILDAILRATRQALRSAE